MLHGSFMYSIASEMCGATFNWLSNDVPQVRDSVHGVQALLESERDSRVRWKLQNLTYLAVVFQRRFREDDEVLAILENELLFLVLIRMSITRWNLLITFSFRSASEWN